jgi:hypothetical protein
MPATITRQKTLIFCTAYVPSPKLAERHMPSLADGTVYLPGGNGEDTFYSWSLRYRIWLDAILTSDLNFDHILIVDDGSPTLPQWEDVMIRHEADDIRCEARIVLHHFQQTLGRHTVSDFPGWARSFLFAARYAQANGFTRVIHLESDAFLISRRMQAYANAVQEGWVTLFCPRHGQPESGIQFIAGHALLRFFSLGTMHHDALRDLDIAAALPFTLVERRFIGDRYGDDSFYIPPQADWSMQTRPNGMLPLPQFYWWLKDVPALTCHATVLGTQQQPAQVPEPQQSLEFSGLSYVEMLWWIDKLLGPRNYLEIGTGGGHALTQISCDAVCIDPDFQIRQNVLGARRRTMFFQDSSDMVFQDEDMRRHFPHGIDLIFLDGLHLFEALLRDFINVERLANERSVVVLHDCLPINTRMTERLRRDGQDEEDPATRGFWTGDVWKILLILKRYRSDLSLCFLDCGPTGLVVCTGLKPRNPILSEQYDHILAEFSDGQVTLAGLSELRLLYPTFNSRQIVNSAYTMDRAFRRG